jgi:hypothetical protein
LLAKDGRIFKALSLILRFGRDDIWSSRREVGRTCHPFPSFRP